MTSSLPFAGPAYDFIDGALAGTVEYREFLTGRLTRAKYCEWVGENVDLLDKFGLNEDQRNLSTRFPRDERAFVAGLIEDLHDAGFLAAGGYPEDEFQAFRRTMGERFRHGRRATYIFPEEARLLFAVAHISRPRRTVFLGSYYGYWAAWAMPGIIAAGGRAILVDIDAEAMTAARSNFAALGFADSTDFLVADATIPCGEADIDLCVLDAEGPKHGGPADLRDKAIYQPIMAANTAQIRAGGLLVAHNMLMQHLTCNAYFQRKVAHNKEQYAKFQLHLDSQYDLHRVIPTTEGVGIYRRSLAGSETARCAE